MGVFDSIKKLVAGDVAHDAADSNKPVGIGGYAKTTAPIAVNADGDRVNAWFDRTGRLFVSEDQLRALLPASIGVKAKAASLGVAIASDQVDADNADPVTNFNGVGGYYQDLTNSAASGMSATKAGRLRMTGQRELLVAPRARWGFGDATDVSKIADLTGSTTNAYSNFTALTAAFLDGSDVGFGASARWIRVPMLEFSRGATIGLYHNLGVNITVNLRADLTGNNSSATVQRPVIDTVTVASGGFVWFAAFPLADGANASMRYVPMLNMPMANAILEITPASDPSSGGLILAVAR